MARVDLTIRGAGVFGLATAFACAKRGAKIRVLEKTAIAAGASGGIVGALAPHAPENWNPLKQFQLESLLMAGEWWGEVARIGGQDPLYARSGRVQPLADDHAIGLAKIREKDAKTLWQGQAEWRLTPTTGAQWEPRSPSGWLIHDTLSGRIAPRAACLALAAAVREMGGEIIEGQQIDDIADEGLVLHATGAAGLRDLSDHFGRNLGAPQKGQAVLFGYDAREAPQLFAEGLHIIAHGDGTVAVGSTSESQWQTEAPDHLADDLITRARHFLPLLENAPVLKTWAGLRPRAKNRAQIFGAYPNRQGHFLANGGFKIGFGMAPKGAEGLADLILENRQTLPEIFNPENLLV